MREIAERLAGEAAVVQVNSEENQDLARRLGVRGIPVLFLLRNGRVMDQLAGAHTVGEVLNWFRSHH